METPVFVFGSTGMLGRYMTSYLKRNNRLHIINVTRKEIDASQVTTNELFDFFKNHDVSYSTKAIVINCMGIIPQSKNVNDTSNLAYFRINSLFPNMLATVCDKLCAKYIHITTDCVFSGNRGMYSETDKHDETNNYGVSKSLGELGINATVIRTSIIGEELKNKYSLLEWVCSHRDTEINGYTNHYWNGVTCLQFAKICQIIISKNLFWKGIRHVHSNKLSKYELVSIINNVYSLNLTIEKKQTESHCDRSMLSKYSKEDFNIPSLEVQIKEMKEFYNNLK